MGIITRYQGGAALLSYACYNCLNMPYLRITAFFNYSETKSTGNSGIIGCSGSERTTGGSVASGRYGIQELPHPLAHFCAKAGLQGDGHYTLLFLLQIMSN